jgi:protoporphyrinogen oxidase
VLELPDEVIGFDVLVSTAPLPELVGRMRDVPPLVRAAAAQLRATHLWYLDLAIDHPCPLPYHWIYVPEPRHPFYRVGCYSSFSPTMAPEGKSSLYVELCDRAEPDLPTLLPRVLDELRAMGLVRTPQSLLFARLRRIDHAYVVFEPGSAEALETVQQYLSAMDVLSVGRYGGWNYSSMMDAIRFGREAAHDAALRLAARTSGERS